MAVLAAGLNWPAAFEVLRAIVDVEHFADDRHGKIWGAMCRLADCGTTPSPITLTAWAQQESDIAELGGQGYIAKLASSAITAVNGREYARVVVEMWRRRRLMAIYEQGIRDCEMGDLSFPAGAIHDQAQQEADTVLTGAADRAAISVGVATARALEEADAAAKGMRTMLTTGFDDLDRILGGFEPGGLYVVGARPGMGKTALGVWSAWAAAKSGAAALFVSLEMSDVALARRLACGLSGVPVAALRKGDVPDPRSWGRLLEAQKSVRDLPLVLDDRGGLNLAQIGATARAVKRRQPLGLIVVDHLGLVVPPRDVGRQGLTASVEHASNGFKRLAKAMECPVMLLCQLNRALEGRDDKRPTLSDLRQSGAIEQDADAVLFLHREHYYASRKLPAREPGETYMGWLTRNHARDVELRTIESEAEVIVSKQRDGALGIVRLHWNAATTRLSNAVNDGRGEETSGT